MSARSLMVLGTGSHVGKSLLVAALCRIFARHGVRVAPFKSQNMSLNSAATPEGLEIGRAQALQAEAAGIAPSVHMNPILLKPTGRMQSQIVVHGRIWGTLAAADYHQRRVEELMPLIEQSFRTLADSYEVLILEGAGSPAEINLKQHDIVNLRIAEMADAPCLLVGDIDRGGVFASLLGTVELLEPHEQARMRGFVVNKFRGDLALLAPGITSIEQRLARPCLGVVPFLEGLTLEEEDSLGLPAVTSARWHTSSSPARPLRVAVVALPSFSNFTDFDALRAEPSVQLHYIQSPAQVTDADVVILPGSKQTVQDLLWLRETGLAEALELQSQRGLIAGICGGMQMLGLSIADPTGVEHAGAVPGLSLLPIDTVMRADKVTSLASGIVDASVWGQPMHLPVGGYEIHIGETAYQPGAEPFAHLRRAGSPMAQQDGCLNAAGTVFGTYLHGLFDRDETRHALLNAARAFFGLDPAWELHPWEAARSRELDRLADHVERSLDMPELFRWVGLAYPDPARFGPAA